MDKGAVNLISSAEARRYRAIPIAFVDEDTLLVATADPANLLGLDNIGISTDLKVNPVVTSPEDLEALLNQLTRLVDSVHEVDVASEGAGEPEET